VPLPIRAERCTQAYERHLRKARSLAGATIINCVSFIRSFLQDRSGGGPVALAHLCAHEVVGFLQRQAPSLHRLLEASRVHPNGRSTGPAADQAEVRQSAEGADSGVNLEWLRIRCQRVLSMR
jgi:hypothetical protein